MAGVRGAKRLAPSRERQRSNRGKPDGEVTPKIRRLRERYLAQLAKDPSDVDRALKKIERGRAWRGFHRKDPAFKQAEDVILGRQQRDVSHPGAFVPFRAHYFGDRGITYPHMRSWIQAYEDPAVRRCIIVGPPEHARTTVMNVQRYAHLAAVESWQIRTGQQLDNPMRAAVVSAGDGLAERMGWQIQQYLTDPFFSGELISDYGPFRGLDRGSRWTSKLAYFAWRGAEEKDPSLQFTGWGGGLQTARLTDATLDDVDDPLNSRSEREKILRYIDQIVIPRLGTTGRLWYLCNRVDNLDVARELLERAEDGTWHAIVQSAIRRCSSAGSAAHSPSCDECGKALWPERIPLEHLKDARKQLRNDRLYALVYLAEPSGEGSDFPLALTERGKDTSRALGPMREPSLRRIVTLDPASTGGAAVMAVAYDPISRKRHLLDADWGTNRHSPGLKAWIRDYVLRYKPEVFAIEAQGGFQLFAEDEALAAFLEDQDCELVHLQTGSNKRDPDYGIPAMRGLFETPEPLISIPWADDASKAKMQLLLDQLSMYAPGTKAAYDLVMCLWFAERIIGSEYETRRTRRSVRVVDPLLQRRPYLRASFMR